MLRSINILNRQNTLRLANTQPLTATVTTTEHVGNRDAYVLRCLRAPANVRRAVRDRAATSTSPGQRSLAVMLTVFNHLSEADKQIFIEAYSRRAVAATGGMRNAALRHIWPYPHTIYPHQEP